MKLTRRKFLTVSLASLPALVGQARTARSGARKPVAAVLEHRENWTGQASGAAILLQRAGFSVIDLTPEYLGRDLSVGSMTTNARRSAVRKRMENPVYEFAAEPDPAKIDLLFFGTFTNHGQPYHDYLRRYAALIPAFVEAGGVVVEMCQWGRYEPLSPSFFPSGMSVLREPWSETDDVWVVAPDHPLVTSWAGRPGETLSFVPQPHRPGRPWEGRRCWQSLAEWKNMRVLLAASGGYRTRGQSQNLPGRAALVEGAHGAGRYVISSLWLDKVYDGDGRAVAEPGTMRVAESFFAALMDYVQAVRNRKAPAVRPTPMLPEPAIGPILGHIDHEHAIVWARPETEGSHTLVLWKAGETPKAGRKLEEVARAENDRCIHWRISGLDADVEYQFQVERAGSIVMSGGFRTAQLPGTPAKASIGFGSCADQKGRFPEVWRRIGREGADGMVLLGDTPYIDSTVAKQFRVKHREFLLHEGPSWLGSRIPLWGTWDDHDFGANNADGRVHNSSEMRKVFSDYRANASVGEAGEGIYTRFRRGPLEVWLLDCRSFAQTAPSFANPEKPTLLGDRQWNWLKEGLRASDAPFKVLAAGMTWSHKGEGLQDDWERYAYEREALVDFIGGEKITGVVLVGGDIHASRVERFDTRDRAGYSLYHFVTSPLHERVFASAAELEHPGLLFSRAEPHSFLLLSADTTRNPATLTAEMINMKGERIYRHQFSLAELSPEPGSRGESTRSQR